MSSCELVKPFTGLAIWFPPVVGLAPDPAAFSLRAPGSLSLARFTFVPLSFVRLPVRVRSRSPKTSGVGRSISPTESVPPESKAGRSSGEIGTDNGGERVQPLPPQGGRDCLSASRSKRECPSSLPPHGGVLFQAIRPPPASRRTGFHNGSPHAVSSAPRSPPALLLPQSPARPRRMRSEPVFTLRWSLYPPRRENVPEGIFAALTAGSRFRLPFRLPPPPGDAPSKRPPRGESCHHFTKFRLDSILKKHG